jgi:hypothetical protein
MKIWKYGNMIHEKKRKNEKKKQKQKQKEKRKKKGENETPLQLLGIEPVTSATPPHALPPTATSPISDIQLPISHIQHPSTYTYPGLPILIPLNKSLPHFIHPAVL